MAPKIRWRKGIKEPRPWPFVYRMTWHEFDGEGGERSFTQRLTYPQTTEWVQIFKANTARALERGQKPPYIKIERAPVGEWDVFFEEGERDGDEPGEADGAAGTEGLHGDLRGVSRPQAAD